MKVALGVRVGPRVKVSMKEWVSGWVAKTFDDVPSVLAKRAISLNDEGAIGEIEALLANHLNIPLLFVL